MIYKETIEKRKIQQIETMRLKAIKKAKQISDMLKKKYGVSEVILFGSICAKTFLHNQSDLDLLVKGIDTDELLKAGYDAWSIAGPFEADIIPWELADKEILRVALLNRIEL